MAQQNTSLTQLIAPHRAALEKAEARLGAAIPATARKFLEPARVTKIMLSALSRNPGLVNCTPESILSVCIAAAELGLEPCSPLQHLYAVPYGREATPVIGYRGLVALARRSGEVGSIQANVVYSGDDFDIELGLEQRLSHKPHLTGVDRGDVIGAYCIVRLRNDPPHIEYVARADLDKRQRASKSQNGPWKLWPDEMRKKTAVRMAMKTMPLSTELATALALDHLHEGVRVVDATEPLREAVPPPPTSKSDELKDLLQEGDNAQS